MTKKIKIFDRISRANLKTMKYMHKTNHFKKSTTKKSTRKECGAIQKMVDIAKSRGYTMEEMLAYDITGNSPLFGDDGFMQKSKKSELVHELENHLSSEDHTGPLSSGKMAITYLVDVMAHIRKASLKDISTFG